MNLLRTCMLRAWVAIGVGLAWPVYAQPNMLFATEANCRLIKGYSKYDLDGVASAFGVPASQVRFVKPQWGRSQTVGHQCQMVFSTPKGNKACAVLSITQGDFVFGQVVSSKGNNAICF